MPHAFTVIGARANVHEEQASGSVLTFDFKVAGVSIFSTLLTIDNGEETTQTASTPAVIDTTSIADDAKVTFECTQVGDGTAEGARGWLIGYATNVSETGTALEITGSPDTTGTVGVPYLSDFGATGGVPPYSFSLVAGTWPDGLALDAPTGETSGTPTTVETQTGLVVQVMDAAGSTDDSDPYSIDIVSALAGVVLLCGFEGADGSTSFVDESPSAHTLSRSGTSLTAEIDTAEFVFGASSLRVPANAGVSAPDSADWAFGAGEFTLEAWIIWNDQTSFSADGGILSQWTQAGGTSWLLRRSSSGGSKFGIDLSASGSGATKSIFGAQTFVNGTKYYVAADRDASGVVRVYTAEYGDTNTTMIASDTYATALFDVAAIMNIGTWTGGGFQWSMNGWIDECRITKGTARYASDSGYPVPTAAFPR
jgi:hypothetical protein